MNQYRSSSVQTEIEKNFPPGNIRLYTKYTKRCNIMFCLLLGEIPAKKTLFSVCIDDITHVSELRKKIYKEKGVALKDIDGNKLTLWSVKIPANDKNLSVLDEASREFCASSKIDFQRYFESKELYPLDQIPQDFREEPPPGIEFIRIIIQPSSTADQGPTDISRVIASLGYLPRQDGLGGTLLSKDECEQNVYTVEGISLTDPDTTQRSDLVSHLAESLEQKRVILVRAPPYSGKTSLAQLLENYLVVNSSKQIRVIRVSLLWGSFVGKKCKYDTFGEVWKKILGIGWHEWVAQCLKVPSILIMDETQAIYKDINEADESMENTGTAVEFWDIIKGCLQRATNLNIIMFAAYGYGSNSAGLSTPVSIPLENSIGLAEIKFTDEELEAYVKNYCFKNLGLSSDDDIVSEFFRYIKFATGGHVGLVRHILQHTKNAMQGGIRGRNLTWKRIYEYLNSDNFSGTVNDCRAAPKVCNLTETQKKTCEDICLNEKVGFYDSDDNTYLIRSGVLVIVVINNQRYLEFAAPLTKRSFFQQYYGKETRAASTPDSLYDFIVRIFKIMSEESVEILNDSRGIGKDKKLLEQTWQKEFYRIGTRALGKRYVLSCDVGATYGSEGFIDFYIVGLEWAIELLREGLDMEEHNRRFDETTGEYKEIVKIAKETAIIDIRSKTKKVRNLKEGFVHVSYFENYGTYMIECLGKETVKIGVNICEN